MALILEAFTHDPKAGSEAGRTIPIVRNSLSHLVSDKAMRLAWTVAEDIFVFHVVEPSRTFSPLSRCSLHKL
jgi:hypothetical protein